MAGAHAVAAWVVAAWAYFVGAESAASQVVELTAASFDEQVEDGRGVPWFVEFYAPWCGHCKALTPTWEKLAVKLKGVAKVAKVDAVNDRWFADEWDVNGFPTLKLISEAKVYTYEGKRNLEELEAFVRRGWRALDPEPLPRDRPFAEKAVKVAFNYAWTYGMPLAAVTSVGLLIWMCWTSEPTEEERERRKIFEEKLAEYERRAAERHKLERTSAASDAKGEREEKPAAEGGADAASLDPSSTAQPQEGKAQEPQVQEEAVEGESEDSKEKDKGEKKND